MTEEQYKHSIRLFRYGAVVVTVVVLVALLAFTFFVNGIFGAQFGDTFNQMLPYIAVITLITAVLGIVFYFVDGAVLRGRIKK